MLFAALWYLPLICFHPNLYSIWLRLRSNDVQWSSLCLEAVILGLVFSFHSSIDGNLNKCNLMNYSKRVIVDFHSYWFKCIQLLAFTVNRILLQWGSNLTRMNLKFNQNFVFCNSALCKRRKSMALLRSQSMSTHH